MASAREVTQAAHRDYQDALARMEAAHTAFLAVLGHSDRNIHVYRAAFDEAEDTMRKVRRWWWIALATKRQHGAAHTTGK